MTADDEVSVVLHRGGLGKSVDLRALGGHLLQLVLVVAGDELTVVAEVLEHGCGRREDQRGAFVVTLGRDTTSVERYTRQRDRLLVEMVGRSPRVLRRTFTYTYEKGALASFEMVVVPPGSVSSAPWPAAIAAARWRCSARHSTG